MKALSDSCFLSVSAFKRKTRPFSDPFAAISSASASHAPKCRRMDSIRHPAAAASRSTFKTRLPSPFPNRNSRRASLTSGVFTAPPCRTGRPMSNARRPGRRPMSNARRPGRRPGRRPPPRPPPRTTPAPFHPLKSKIANWHEPGKRPTPCQICHATRQPYSHKGLARPAGNAGVICHQDTPPASPTATRDFAKIGA